MQIPYFKCFRKTCKNVLGFTLVEVMVVMVIVAILATGVVFMFANPSARVKGQVFTMLGDFNFARSEAVNRNLDVLVYFLEDVSEECRDDIAKCADAGNFDGYLICLDGEPDGDCDTADTILRTVLFNQEVQLYDTSATNGPDKKPYTNSDGTTDSLLMADGPDVDGDNDGVSFDILNNGVYFTQMGTPVVCDDPATPPCSLNSLAQTGYALIYYPVSAADHATMRAAPYALVVTPGVGSINIARWNSRDSVWKTK